MIITEVHYCPLTGDRPDSFEGYLELASIIVSSWPAWKQDCLNDSPYVAVPRTPMRPETPKE